MFAPHSSSQPQGPNPPQQAPFLSGRSVVSLDPPARHLVSSARHHFLSVRHVVPTRHLVSHLLGTLTPVRMFDSLLMNALIVSTTWDGLNWLDFPAPYSASISSNCSNVMDNQPSSVKSPEILSFSQTVLPNQSTRRQTKWGLIALSIFCAGSQDGD